METQTQQEETIDIEYPRLIHGTTLTSLEGILTEGALAPESKRTKNGPQGGFHSENAETNGINPDRGRETLWYSIIGSHLRLLGGEDYTKEIGRETMQFKSMNLPFMYNHSPQDTLSSLYEVYLLIDEKRAFIENNSQKSTKTAELECAAWKDDWDRSITEIYTTLEDSNTFIEADGKISLTPYGYGGQMLHTGTFLDLETLREARRKGIQNPDLKFQKELYAAHIEDGITPYSNDVGIQSNYIVPIEAIVGAVVLPFEKNLRRGNTPQITTQDAVDQIKSFFEKYNIDEKSRFPIFDMNNRCLYSPKV